MKIMRTIGRTLLFLTFVSAPLLARPAVTPGLPLGGLAPGGSLPWNIVVLLTLLTLLPAILLSMTPFVRLLVVFHFLRQALGTQTAPTNQTLIGLSLFLTYFLMQPVFVSVRKDALTPYEHGKINAWQALDRSAVPMRHFMLDYTREKDLALFLEMSKEPRPAKPEDLSMSIVISV